MDPVAPRKITRNRESKACIECQRRKLKCDRQFPCLACSKRNEARSCVYGHTLNGKTSKAEARLGHLERLVEELSQSQALSAGINGAAIELGSSQRQRDDASDGDLYNGPTHWAAMLEDIAELRESIQDYDVSYSSEPPSSVQDDDSLNILFGTSESLPISQVVSRYLPSRKEVDRKVASYFRAKSVAVPFIHSGQFTRQYTSFWSDPYSAPPLWISILFSILDVATRSLLSDSDQAPNQSLPNDRFAIAAAHCLRDGQYYRPQQFSVEALLLFLQSQCFAILDVSPEIGIVFGTLIRLATVMGYHRDPDSSPAHFSAFTSEMRRRTWSLCLQLDILISFQLGLPSNVQHPMWDTKPPTNLRDSDFDEDINQLPAAKPDTEPTELLFYIAKHRMMAVFEKVVRHVLSTAEQSDDEIAVIEKELDETYSSLPLGFRPRPMAESIVDPPSIVVTRLCVSFIYQKSLIVLHRKHVRSSNERSMRACQQAASTLVSQFLDFYLEFEEGGQLCTERWFMGSITWHDFLLACTALCLTLCTCANTAVASNGPSSLDLGTLVDLLRRAETLCVEQQSSRSRDTRKVQRLLRAVTMRFNVQDDPTTNWTQSALDSQQEATAGAIPALVPPFTWADNYQVRNQYTSTLTDDPTWTFMEQFLNLPGDDYMVDG